MFGRDRKPRRSRRFLLYVLLISCCTISLIRMFSARLPESFFHSSHSTSYTSLRSKSNQVPDPLSQANLLPPTPDEIFSPVRYPRRHQTVPATLSGLIYHPNGHLLFKLPSYRLETHPFTTLIERAKIEWEVKVARQSRTLKEAVYEYKRRYRRNPPAGFEHWYAYAVENEVPLIDEYDEITRDLFPLWALPPAELRARAEKMKETEVSPFLLSFSGERLIREGQSAETGNANYLSGICGQFMSKLASANLPPVSILVRSLDEPRLLLGWEQKKRLYELAGSGQFLEPDDQFNGAKVRAYTPSDEKKWAPDWTVHCPPDSSIRRSSNNLSPSHSSRTDSYLDRLDNLKKSTTHSAIFHHPRAMDLCMNPENIDLHGATAGRAWSPTPMVPLFAISKTALHDDILVVPPLWDETDHYETEIPWAERPHKKLYWRGSVTGTIYTDQNAKWNTSQRIRLHQFTHNPKPSARVLMGGNKLSKLTSSKFRYDSVTEFQASSEELNERYMNISLVGAPYQCDPDQCKKISEMIKFGHDISGEEEANHQYMLDVDGNGWSGRFHRLLATKHVVLKSTMLPEWYTDRIQPWYHYVPSKVDYSDLYDIMSFFTGGINGEGSHEDLAEAIAQQGQDWVRSHFRDADMAAYMFRLVLEYIRIYHRAEDGTSADFDETLIS